MFRVFKVYSIAAVVMFIVSGCSSHSITAYKIYPKIKTVDYKDICRGKTLSVGKIFTAHGVMLEEMKYATQDYKEFSYTESEWANKPSREIDRALLRSIRGARIFDSVNGYRSHAKSDLRLETNVYSFMQYYSKDKKESYVDVSFSFSLVNQKTSKSIKSTVISTRVKCETADAEGGVIALNHALEIILEKTNIWLSSDCH